VDLEEGGAISGSTTLHLTISPASLADSGLYDAVVSNECGEAVSVAVEEVVLPGCAADFNSDGRVDSQDFFDFVAAFLAGDPRADTDGSGVVDSQDFFDFIVVFFGGC
jgi:hypothetical protein